MILLLLYGCDGPASKPGTPDPADTDTDTDADSDTDADTDTDTDTTTVCPAGRVVTGHVTGAVLALPNVYVAALDAGNWRLGDALDMSDVVAPEASTGAFSLCLDESVPLSDVYAKAVVAAWQDLDGDQRYDNATELLCDQPTGGGATVYLYYGTSPIGVAWAVGVDRDGAGDLATVFSPTLDGDACQR
jgi:hypothetical protein